MSNFEAEVADRVSRNEDNKPLQSGAHAFMLASIAAQYSYNFSWLGRPVIQYPQDVLAMQEIIWRVKPDLIIETGIAHGGSLIMSASMLALLDYCESREAGQKLDTNASVRRVLGIDIDIRAGNKAAIQSHALAHKVEMIEGSSIDQKVIDQVCQIAARHKRILVCLDSNHTHEHVLAELEAYAPLTSEGSYCVVFDTMIEDFPEHAYTDRLWSVGNNPKTAVTEYLRRLNATGKTALDGRPLMLQVDRSIENKLLITVAPSGYLRRVQSS